MHIQQPGFRIKKASLVERPGEGWKGREVGVLVIDSAGLIK
jgi:hypothetical protein